MADKKISRGTNSRLVRKADRSKAEKIQTALYQIADAASAVTDMQEFYTALHRIVGKLMYAKNFYISLYDPATHILSAPYFADEAGDTAPPPAKLEEFSKTLRAHVLRTGKTLHVSGKEIEEGRQRGKFMPMGTPAEDWLGVPLKAGGHVIGMLTLQSYKKGIRYEEHDVQVIEFVAQHISTALTRARAIDETRQRNTELQIINSVQAGLASKLDLQAIYELIGEKVREVFNVQVVDIVNYDSVNNLISMPYSYEKGDRSVIAPREPYGFRQQVIKSGAPLLINQNFVELASQYNNPLLTGAWPKSALFVPLLVDGKVKSIISIQDIDGENAFSTSDVQLLQTLSNAMGVALENARLFEETQRAFQAERRAHEQTETLRSVALALNRSLSLREVFDLVLTEIQKVIPYDSAGVYQVQDNHRVFVTGRGFANLDDLIGVGFEFNQQDDEIGYLIFQSLQPLILEDASVQYPQYFSAGPHAATKIRSYMAVPIVLNQKLIGMITLDREEPSFYKDEHARLAMTFAAQAATAINNARLFDETQRLLKETEQRNAELAIINSVQAALAAQLDIHEIYEAVGEKLREIFNYQDVSLYSADLKTHVMTIEYSFEKGRKFERQSVPMNSLYEYVVAEDRTFVFNGNAAEFAAQFEDYKVPSGEFPKSLLIVPVRRKQGSNLAVYLTLQDVEGKRVFSDSDVRLLETLANSMSVALENARLFDETQQRNSELAIINGVQSALAAQLDIHSIYDAVGEELQKVFSAQTISIYSSDQQTRTVTAEYGFEKGRRLQQVSVPFNSLYEHLLRLNATFVFNGDFPQFAAQFKDYQVPRGTLARSIVGVPIPTKRDADSVVYLTLQDIDGGKTFGESDVRLLETLAASMSVALENARLWEQEKMYRKALERELEIGREIQAGFLPEALPLVEGWEIAATLMSAREVAGDFYDAFELPDGTIGLVIADVCDKGVGAALFMTLFRSLIRITSNLEYFEHTERANLHYSTPERLKRAMLLTNNYIAETHGDSGMFATLFFGILDPRNGKLTYINGGHEPPLIIQSGITRETLYKTGPAIGAVTGRQFDLHEIQLDAGDMLFAFTDGVPDCKDPRGEFFGRERLLKILRQSSGSAHELVKTIETELHRYIANAIQFDDITLLAVRWAHASLV